MAYDGAFAPNGDTVLVGTTIVQVKARSNVETQNYRVRCLVTGYISWATSNNPTAPTFAATAPVAGTPSPNTLGMTVGGVETFCLANDAYFLSSVVAGFEVTPGEGL